MREIKFRGKRTDNGEWIYGDLMQNVDCVKIREQEKDVKHIAKSFEIDPETIGQFTGLKDKNGTMIWEGDIVAWNSGEMDIDGKYFDDELFLVKFSSLTFGFVKNYGTKYSEYSEETFEGETGINLKVIGNIQDNPEFFERRC